MPIGEHYILEHSTRGTKLRGNSIYGTFNSGNYKEAFHQSNRSSGTVLHSTQQDLTPEEHSTLSTGEHSTREHSTRQHSIRGTFHQKHSTFSTEGEHSMVEYSAWEHSVRGTFHRGTFHCEHSTFFTEAHSMQEHSIVEYSTWEHSIGEPQHRETFQPGIFNLGHRKPVDIPRGTLHPFARGTFHHGIFRSGKNTWGTWHQEHSTLFTWKYSIFPSTKQNKNTINNKNNKQTTMY